MIGRFGPLLAKNFGAYVAIYGTVQFSYPLLDKAPNKMTAGNLLNGYSIKYLYRQTESEMNDKNFDSGSALCTAALRCVALSYLWKSKEGSRKKKVERRK